MDHLGLPSSIVTGGQTGVDRAAMDVALELGLPLSGWCPAGRLAEDGQIDTKYGLRETPTADYAQRTEWNVRDSDATLVLCIGEPEGGTLLTVECARKWGRPYLVIQLPELDLPISNSQKCIFRKWISDNKTAKLNIAGHRESYMPGEVYCRARTTIQFLLDMNS